MYKHIAFRTVAMFTLLLLISACAELVASQTELSGMEMDKDADLELTPGQFTIENMVGNLTLPTETGAIYLSMLNGTADDETLLAAEIEGCEATEIHEVIMNNEVMTMRPVEGGQVIIPAGEIVTLKQGGLHLMCIGKTREFVAGDETALTLTFAKAGTLSLAVTVRDIAEMGKPHNHN